MVNPQAWALLPSTTHLTLSLNVQPPRYFLSAWVLFQLPLQITELFWANLRSQPTRGKEKGMEGPLWPPSCQ